MRILIKNGRLIDPANDLDGRFDLAIADGKVVAVGPSIGDFHADRQIDAKGLVVCPGLIDLCARLREPGQEHTATIASETRAAAAGGITTLVCPPDTDPVIDEPAVAELIRDRWQAAGHARVLPVGALTVGLAGRQLAELATLTEAGCVAIGDGGRPLTDTLVLRRALKYAAGFDLTVMLTPLDPWLAANGCAHDGPVADRLGLTGIPVAAESARLARDLDLIADLGVRLHVGRLSSRRAVELVGMARQRGLTVSADVSAHQLHLTEHDLGRFDSACHVLPPLRSTTDRDSLRTGLADGTISALCSDHQPLDADAKQNPFADTAPGIAGLDTLLVLGLALVDDQTLTLPTLIARLTAGPAAVLGLDSGHLAVGAVADVCVFDTNPAHRHWLSAGRNSPFRDHKLSGRVCHTLLAGRPVYDQAAP